MNARPHDYLLFGLRVRSELELPELPRAPSDAEPDVWIRSGSIAIPRSKTGLSVQGGALVFAVDEVARYRVVGGAEITVEAEPGVDPRNVRLFLLGSAFGALLHQRGLLPLHANAVDVDGKALAFMGESGAGKSTLAAWFHDHDYQVLADDVCVIHFDGAGEPSVFPGLPRLRLWSDAIDRSGRDREGLDRSYVGDDAAADKFDVPVSRLSSPHDEVPLKALFVLDRVERFALELLTGVDAAEAIFGHTYRGSFIASTGDPRKHWTSVLQLARKTSIYRVSRRWDYGHFDEDFSTILDEVARIVGT